MNKQELISKIAEETKLTKKDVDLVLKSFTSEVTKAMAGGEDLVLPGFGTFTVSERAERMGRNPSTGESITIPAAKMPKLKFGKAVKDLINK